MSSRNWRANTHTIQSLFCESTNSRWEESTERSSLLVLPCWRVGFSTCDFGGTLTDSFWKWAIVLLDELINTRHPPLPHQMVLAFGFTSLEADLCFTAKEAETDWLNSGRSGDLNQV